MHKLTPMMQQYKETKISYPDCLLFFRVGDFFELFFEDAKIASRELNIVLTSRDGNKEQGIPMAGVPHHALETYLARLIKRGFKVAICDQVEDPQLAKGLVKREIVRVITPGTIIEDAFLEPGLNNWLLALCRKGKKWGLAYTDISTGEFLCSELDCPVEHIEAIITSLGPGEILVSAETAKELTGTIVTLTDSVNELPPAFAPPDHRIWFHAAAQYAAAMILAYLRDKHRLDASHLACPVWQDFSKYMYIDGISLRNLEITSSLDGNRNGPCLLKVINKTLTAMGGRLLVQNLVTPLADVAEVKQRLDCITLFKDNYQLRKKIHKILGQVYDLERIVTKINYRTANARDLQALKQSLQLLPELSQLLAGESLPPLLVQTISRMAGFEELCQEINATLTPNPPATVTEGNIIRPGFSTQLDELRILSRRGSAWLKEYEQNLRESSGIRTLKLGFNKVFGYYVEVSKSNSEPVPEEFVRKQTLVNAERYITPALKEWEDKILSATERQYSLEYQLFSALRDKVLGYSAKIQACARALAAVDCHSSLAQVAEDYNYCRPQVDESSIIDITEGRHPIVERFGKTTFVANDCRMDTDLRQIMIITGPNMAGKSTYMRQTALIAMLAQVGSYVPATAARIGILDGIFTRIGASDDLASGQSTFMVEMTELARILRRATGNSLVLLDEIGRGTGTTDGISIARATIEYLHNTPGMSAKTLFATHYHQLTALEGLPRVTNCSVQVSEALGKVTFLHKINEGGSDRSYGIHVARLAGLPEDLIGSAEQYVRQSVSEPQLVAEGQYAVARDYSDPLILDLLRELARLEPDDLSPRQAWEALDYLHKLAIRYLKEEPGHEN